MRGIARIASRLTQATHTNPPASKTRLRAHASTRLRSGICFLPDPPSGFTYWPFAPLPTTQIDPLPRIAESARRRRKTLSPPPPPPTPPPRRDGAVGDHGHHGLLPRPPPHLPPRAARPAPPHRAQPSQAPRLRLQADTFYIRRRGLSAQEHSGEGLGSWSERRKRGPSLARPHEAISTDPAPPSRPARRATQAPLDHEQGRRSSEARLQDLNARLEREDAVLAPEHPAQVLPYPPHDDAVHQDQREQPVQAPLQLAVPVRHSQEEGHDGGRLPEGHRPANGVRDACR